MRRCDVRIRAPQARLDHHAAVLAEPGEEPVAEEVERALGVRGALHVEAHETIVLLRPLQDPRHVAQAEFLVDVEAHLRQLDRHVHLVVRRRHRVDHLHVLRAGCLGLGGLGHALAQQVERGRDALRLERGGGRHRLGDRLPGHEARGELLGQAVAAHEVEDLLLFRQPEQRVAHHAISILAGGPGDRPQAKGRSPGCLSWRAVLPQRWLSEARAGRLGALRPWPRLPGRGSTGMSRRSRGMVSGSSDARYASIAVRVAFCFTSSNTILSNVSRLVCHV